LTTLCAELHSLARHGTLHGFPFDRTRLPVNGIYVLFETGEEAHGGDRIVRVGTHTGENQLPSRLMQHFVNENKDRSIFRKNIGRALLNKAGDLFLAEWELDRTSRAARLRHGPEQQTAKRLAVEREVTKYLQSHFRFVVFRVDDKRDRLALESRIISTVSGCDECRPSDAWLGLSSPKEKIRQCGLWLVNELYKEPLAQADLQVLGTLLT
jgi:hypothetical protein